MTETLWSRSAFHTLAAKTGLKRRFLTLSHFIVNVPLSPIFSSPGNLAHGLLDAELLEILRSPLLPDGPPLELQGDWLVCREGGHRFRIVEGIPHLLPEDAVPLEEVSA